MEDEAIKFLNMLLNMQTISNQALEVLSRQLKEIEDLPGAEPIVILLKMSHQTIEIQAEMIRKLGESSMRIGDRISEVVAQVDNLKESP